MKRNEFKKLGNTIKNNWRVALVVIIMMAISGYVLANYGLTKHYVTTTDIYIESTDDTPPTEKAAMAVLLFTSPKMYDAINENLTIQFSYAELEKIITVTQVNDTQLITASFDCQTSMESYKLSELYLQLIQRVLDDYDAKASTRVVRTPIEPQKPVFPDDTLFTIVGASAGAVISVLGLLIIWRLDNTISSADDITDEYGVPVIGELMDFDNEIDYLGR
ncbi:MAG: hypothetical protein IJT87_10050 [Ruminiclostridium sp.]|nr:hypothetical protein [Ruminiclostridium sp.]